AHEDDAVLVPGGQVLEQRRDHLDDLAARLGHPLDVALRELLDALELVVAAGVVLVGAPQAVGEDGEAPCLEHLHHERGARAGQPRHPGDEGSLGHVAASPTGYRPANASTERAMPSASSPCLA